MRLYCPITPLSHNNHILCTEIYNMCIHSVLQTTSTFQASASYELHLPSKKVNIFSFCFSMIVLTAAEGIHVMISIHHHPPPSLDPTHPHPGHNISCCLQTTNHSQPSPALSSGEYEQGCTHYNIINIVTWTSHYNRLHFIPTQPTIFTFCRETQLFVCILHTKYFT